MPHDFEEVFDVDDLDDDELQQLVYETLRGTRSLDVHEIQIHVHDGAVTLSGRVGTDGERRIAERVVSDRIGVERVKNNLLVDPLYRADSPEAIDEHLVDEEEHEGLLLGDRAVSMDPEAEYLADDPEGELYGTVDRTKSMEEGIPWVPPDTPSPEGEDGTGTERDAGRDSY